MLDDTIHFPDNETRGQELEDTNPKKPKKPQHTKAVPVSGLRRVRGKLGVLVKYEGGTLFYETKELKPHYFLTDEDLNNA